MTNKTGQEDALIGVHPVASVAREPVEVRTNRLTSVVCVTGTDNCGRPIDAQFAPSDLDVTNHGDKKVVQESTARKGE